MPLQHCVHSVCQRREVISVQVSFQIGLFVAAPATAATIPLLPAILPSCLNCGGFQRLPLAVDLEAFRPPETSRRSSEVKMQISEGGAAPGPSKRLIHRDMGVVVICCEWPR